MQQLLNADSSRNAQLKIQQMAFVLVGLVILFAFAGLFFFIFWISNLEDIAAENNAREAREIALALTGTPELGFTAASDCTSCIDLDKALLLKERTTYTSFWNLDYLVIERVYPAASDTECTRAHYPDCNQITLIHTREEFGATEPVFVTLVKWEPQGKYYTYELGRILASGRGDS